MLMCGTGVFIRRLFYDISQFVSLNRQFNIGIRHLASYIRHLQFYSPLQRTYSPTQPRYLPPNTTYAPPQLL